MLITCPECDLMVSDKATSCPHCGYPMKLELKKTPREKSPKRMRLPNGFGRITKLSNPNLREPYRAMITVGKNDLGKPIGKLLKPKAYFKTYNDAYAAIVEYHKHPADFSKTITVKEVYEKWLTEYHKDLKKESSIRTVTSAWAYCSSTYSMPFSDIRARHIKYCLTDGYIIVPNGKQKGEKRFATPNTRSRIKSLWNLLMDYGVEYELTDKNYARMFQVSRNSKISDSDVVTKGHMVFSDEEIKLLWKNITMPWVDVILIQCYTGFRPQELGLIKLSDIDLTNHFIVGGMKTEAGTDRIVPIHSAIFPLVVKKYHEAEDLNSTYLFNAADSQTHIKNLALTYDKYRHRFDKVISSLKLNPDHRAHDPRKHFITMAKKYHVDEYAIKRIVGHNINDITEKVYTERDLDWLKSEIEKIKAPTI